MGLLSAVSVWPPGRRSRTAPQRPRPSVQTTFLAVSSIDEGVVSLDGHQFRAVLEVGGINFGLRGELDQEALVAGYAAFLNSLTYPVQILARGLPIDVDSYLGELERRARCDLPEQLAALARDHVLFLKRLARNRSLLERRFYIVVPAEISAAAGSSGGAGGRWWPFRARRDGAGAGVGAAAGAAARKQLTFRCEEVQRQLARCGLAVRRLESTELAQLYYACWCPELARIQRLRGRLDDYTSLVVRAAESHRGSHDAHGAAADRRWP